MKRKEDEGEEREGDEGKFASIGVRFTTLTERGRMDHNVKKQYVLSVILA